MDLKEIRKILKDFMDFEGCRQTIRASSPFSDVWRKEEIARARRELKKEVEGELEEYLKETPVTSGLGRWMR